MRKKKSKRRRIEGYKQSGKSLKPPLLAGSVRVMPVDYHLHVLPQLLWLESLLDYYGESRFPHVAHGFQNLVEPLIPKLWKPELQVVPGFVESFRFVPEEQRQPFVHNNKAAVEDSVIRPFGNVLQLYNDCPMKWLLSCYGEGERFDLDRAIESAQRWTASLVDRAGDHSNMTRAFILARYIKSGTLQLPHSMPLDDLPHYPNCPNRALVDSLIRATSNAIFGQVFATLSWGNIFWETNGRISMCIRRPQNIVQRSGEEPHSALATICREAGDRFIAAVQEDYQKIIPDPTSFEKTASLSGLLARASSLCVQMLKYKNLWIAETGGILLRCLCDALIVLAWLLYKNDHTLFSRFVEYSFGQQDLYGMKLDDNEGYRDAFRTLYLGSDKSADTIARETFDAQLRPIDLGNWADTNTRKMAEEAGVKQFYDIVFTFYSADVHSHFISLARHNLEFCANPLHNNHMIPAFERGLLVPSLPLTACVLAREVCQRFFRFYKVESSCTRVLSKLLQEASPLVTGE